MPALSGSFTSVVTNSGTTKYDLIVVPIKQSEAELFSIINQNVEFVQDPGEDKEAVLSDMRKAQQKICSSWEYYATATEVVKAICPMGVTENSGVEALPALPSAYSSVAIERHAVAMELLNSDCADNVD
jgi:hypothetical protein